MTKPRILILGDSHIHAIKDALREAKPETDGFDVTALRIISKSGLGDITFDEGLAMCAQLTGSDFLATAFRGNQYNTIGLIQHARPFDVMLTETAPMVEGALEVIPLNLFRQFFYDTLKGGYGRLLLKVKETTKAPMACLAPPAPKEDGQLIKRKAETFFRNAGIAEFGVSPAQLRLKLWTLQDEALARYCAENSMIHLGNPSPARDENGYLRREYYFNDGTHGNSQYGALVIEQLVNFARATA